MCVRFAIEVSACLVCVMLCVCRVVFVWLIVCGCFVCLCLKVVIDVCVVCFVCCVVCVCRCVCGCVMFVCCLCVTELCD